jgi:hypothetical protein
MRNAMRSIVLGTALTFGVASAPQAQVSIGISTPNVSIGINVPSYPAMTVIPGYPVYYAPQLDTNYFYYDGLYWVYAYDNWYSSYWYNGPWTVVAPTYVPVYILRVPVRYYRVVPVYFRNWHPDAPPHWGQRWGRDWERRRSGWDRWDRDAAPRPAPLPTYQRQYTGERYPRREQQVVLHDQNYRYQPRDHFVREHYQKERAQRAPAPQARSAPPGHQARDESRPMPTQQGEQPTPQSPSQRNGAPPREQPSEHDRRDAQREPPGQARREAPPPQQQRSAPPQQQSTQRTTPQQPPQVQGRAAEPPRQPKVDAHGGGRPDTAARPPDAGGGKGQDRGSDGRGGNGGKSSKGTDDNGKK